MKTNRNSQDHSQQNFFGFEPSNVIQTGRLARSLVFLLALFTFSNCLWGQAQPKFRIGDRSERIEKSVFALIYVIVISKDSIVANLLGTTFLVEGNKMLTANHVLSESGFRNKVGQYDVLYFLLKRGNDFSYQVKRNNIKSFPGVDLSIITIDTLIPNAIPVELLPISGSEQYRLVRSYGHKPGKTPIMSYHWVNNHFVIDNYDINHLKVDQIGYITASDVSNVKIEGLSLNKVGILELSFGGERGVSGGPVLYRGSGELLGMMSYKTEPPNTQYAIHVNELIRYQK